MVKCRAYPAEWYPVILLRPGMQSEDVADFSEEDLRELKRVSDEFMQWQQKLAERFGYEHHSVDDLVDERIFDGKI